MGLLTTPAGNADPKTQVVQNVDIERAKFELVKSQIIESTLSRVTESLFKIISKSTNLDVVNMHLLSPILEFRPKLNSTQKDILTLPIDELSVYPDLINSLHQSLRSFMDFINKFRGRFFNLNMNEIDDVMNEFRGHISLEKISSLYSDRLRSFNESQRTNILHSIWTLQSYIVAKIERTLIDALKSQVERGYLN